VIIGDQPLAKLVPLARGAGKEIITQFPAYPCEEIGLLKMDFLGLKTLTIIQDTLDLVNRYRDDELTPDDIPLTCEKTYKLLNRGATTGVFQLESGGMQELCKNFRISKIEEIIALVALYRPGPMEFIPTFIACKTGKEQPEYETKEMEELLSETYGIMVYQEQIMQVVQAVAGFTLAQADIMRRAIGKKKEKVLIEQGMLFKEGCLKKGHSEAIADSVWAKILKFASYGFNKSHSACYGLLSYRTAYLKANYPAEFMAAVLNAEINNAEKLAFYIAECKEMGIKILPPNVDVSLELFSVDGSNIRFGIAGLKGVGSGAASAIINAQKDGKFKDLVDFCERVGSKVNKRVMENLCKAGAFDIFGYHRSQIMAVYEQALSMAAQTIKDKASGQGSLFDFFDAGEQESVKALSYPEISEWDELDLLGYEKELLGFYVSGHPLGENAELIRTYATHSIAKLCNLVDGDVGVLTGGMINAIKSVVTKKGDKMAILDVEDLEGHTEVVVFPKTYQKVAHHLEVGNIVFVSALTDAKDQTMQLLAENIYSMEEMLQTFTKEIHIRLNEGGNSEEEVDRLKEICRSNHGDIPLVFCVTCSNGDIGFIRSHVKYYVDMSDRFINQVSELLGRKVIHLKADRSLVPERRKRWSKGT
jgi:DNA polymerase-3 subunit alpha